MTVVVAGPSGRELRVEAQVCEPSEGESDVLVPSLITGVLLLSGIVFPPCLLFNLPILLVRAALSQAHRASYDRLRLGPFDCPDCGGANAQAELAGALPLATTCSACGAAFSVRQGPRRNLVEEETPPPATPDA